MRVRPDLLTRRALLARSGALAAAVTLDAGCRDRRPPPPPDPDAAALHAARDVESRLVSAYAALAANPAAAGAAHYTRLRDVHQAHLQALGGGAISASPTASAATPGPATSSPAAADAAVAASTAVLHQAANNAVGGRHAAVLASIAAAHAVEVQFRAPTARPTTAP